ncbi:hypothetical protein BGZ60DRAFT_5954 [Tricladium varicosporioides]|nr:hypothetical protein BGZ60DRAFT_5954 [Hymenoscyphus varicosporioides]
MQYRVAHDVADVSRSNWPYGRTPSSESLNSKTFLIPLKVLWLVVIFSTTTSDLATEVQEPRIVLRTVNSAILITSSIEILSYAGTNVPEFGEVAVVKERTDRVVPVGSPRCREEAGLSSETAHVVHENVILCCWNRGPPYSNCTIHLELHQPTHTGVLIFLDSMTQKQKRFISHRDDYQMRLGSTAARSRENPKNTILTEPHIAPSPVPCSYSSQLSTIYGVPAPSRGTSSSSKKIQPKQQDWRQLPWSDIHLCKICAE